MRQAGGRRPSRRGLAVLVLVAVALVVGIAGWAFSLPGVGTTTTSRSDATTTSAGGAPSAAAASSTAAAPSPDALAASTTAPAPASATDSAPASTAPTTGQAVSEGGLLPSRLPDDAVEVHAPILMYHYVDETPPPAGPYADGLTVRTNDFRAEMEYLANNGYQTVSFADIYLAMCGEKELPARALVLTFDDGGLDNYEVAFPILKEYGFKGTFFVITKTVGKDGQMTWEQLREMAGQGMSIQSHTVSHPDLRQVSATRLQTELVDSRQAIADAIGEPSYALSYPAGAYDDTVIAATRSAGYLMAVATDNGKEGDPAAVYEMKRRRVQAFLPLETFARLVR